MRNEMQIKNHKGKNILIVDFSKATKETLPEIIADVKDYIKKQPQKSVYTLTDVTNLSFNRQTIEQFKDLTVSNKPYVAAGAVIGVQGLQKIAYQTIMAFSGRKMPPFNTREDGMDWLAKQ